MFLCIGLRHQQFEYVTLKATFYCLFSSWVTRRGNKLGAFYVNNFTCFLILGCPLGQHVQEFARSRRCTHFQFITISVDGFAYIISVTLFHEWALYSSACHVESCTIRPVVVWLKIHCFVRESKKTFHLFVHLCMVVRSWSE